jgi:hypothetical protein
MSIRDLQYIKTRVYDRKFRLYLDFDQYSYISADLIYSIDPSIIQTDFDGDFVLLDLDYTTVDGARHTKTVCFDVIETGGSFEFVLGYETLKYHDFDDLGLFLEAGEVPIYCRR